MIGHAPDGGSRASQRLRIGKTSGLRLEALAALLVNPCGNDSCSCARRWRCLIRLDGGAGGSAQRRRTSRRSPLSMRRTSSFHSACDSRTTFASSPIVTAWSVISTSEQAVQAGHRVNLFGSMGSDTSLRRRIFRTESPPAVTVRLPDSPPQQRRLISRSGRQRHRRGRGSGTRVS